MLAGLLPAIETVTGCPFHRQLGEDIAGWPLPADAAPVRLPTPLVELPLGATEDRVLGALHFEKALRGERALEPGLLAAANRGILYIDEVNLLPDHLVDGLLDAAATGIYRLEREGLSLAYPARFVLIGTMNPEEGDLRPQLLDRFGLAVDVNDLSDPALRAEAVARRLAFETDAEGFADSWHHADRDEAERIVRARELLPRAHISGPLLHSISERCLAAGVEGLRADLTICRAAIAWTAYGGRTEVQAADIEAVAELALAHRRTHGPPPPSDGQPVNAPDRSTDPAKPRSGEGSPREGLTTSDNRVFESAGLFAARARPPLRLPSSSVVGRWRKPAEGRVGQSQNAVRLFEPGAAVAWSATVRAAAPCGKSRAGAANRAHPLVLGPRDLRAWPKRGPSGCLLLFVLDASGSMAAWRRMRQTKAAVLALLMQAYHRRDRVALLAFRGAGAELVLPPGRGLARARQALERLPIGGPTPLAAALAAAGGFIHGQARRQPRQPIWAVVLTDGRANVARAGGDAWADALAATRPLVALPADYLVVDTETAWPRFGRARRVGPRLAAPCLEIEGVLGRPLPDRRHGVTAIA